MISLKKYFRFLFKGIILGLIVILVFFELLDVKSISFNPSLVFRYKLAPKKPTLIDLIKKYSKPVPGHNANYTNMDFVILAMTDSVFTDMALNLYISSFERFGIENYLFIGAGNNACARLVKKNIHCFDFWEDQDANRTNNYGSLEFNRKMNIRTEMILTAIRSNYSVLHTDLDVVFLQNPMPEIERMLQNHSMAILWDHSVYNAGFLAIKATPFSIEVYEYMQNRTNKSLSIDDQTVLNQAIHVTWKKYQKKTFREFPIVLDKNRYLCGKDFFERNRNFPRADFSDNCPNCVVVHNNWIVGKEAKIYRFKESAMWYFDEDGYYSDVNRKYLLYYNPILKNYSKADVRNNETMALRTGFKIAAMLNRTLIIPRFHCISDFECPLNSWFNVKTFHDQFFPNYRESSFLLNDLVPRSISMKPDKNCLTPSHDEDFQMSSKHSRICNKQDINLNARCVPFRPLPILMLTKDNKHIWESLLTAFPLQEIIDLSSLDSVDEPLVIDKFDNCADQVLVFSSLIGVNVQFSDKIKNSMFDNKLNKGLIPGNYIQL